MAVVEINTQDFPGSVLTGSGADTLKLVGGGTFDFAYATVSGFSEIDFDTATVRISGEKLAGVTTINSGTNYFSSIILTGSQIDLRGKTFTGTGHIYIGASNTTVTVSDLPLALRLDAMRPLGEKIVFDGVASITEQSRIDLFANGFDTIVAGQNQWTNAAPTITGLGGERLHVWAGESVLLDPEGDCVMSDAEGPIAYLGIAVSDSSRSDVMSNFIIGQNFKIVDGDFHRQDLLYKGNVIGTVSASSDSASLTFNQYATADVLNEFARSLAYAPANATYSNVSVTITAYDSGSRRTEAVVQIDVAAKPPGPEGTADDDRLIGQAGDDTLYGRSGNDTLRGEAGNDRLWGGLGNDVLTGGSGKDVFVFDTKPNKKTNMDKIVDFTVKDDTLWLAHTVFKKLGKGSEAKPGKLNKAFFTIGDHAKDKNDYLIYDTKKGVLYYDADGSGQGKAVEIATLKKGLKMTYLDFMVI